MKKWEYTYVELASYNRFKLLNEYGDKGWELVCLTGGGSDGARYGWFKREKSEVGHIKGKEK